MRFASIDHNGKEEAAVRVPAGGWVPVLQLPLDLPCDFLGLIQRSSESDDLHNRIAECLATADFRVIAEPTFVAPYRRPRKVWGIGLNYREHAADLESSSPEEPASFIKADHTIIGPGESICLPGQSARVTGEAELGIVIGRECWEVSEEEALDYAFGFCPILDQTAEDILMRNPRFLTRAKNFPSFFSFGPEVVTVDEYLGSRDIDDVTVATWLNGSEVRASSIANMSHGPLKLISFHSQVMPFFPGDVISTGTPGAVAVSGGDLLECRIDGMEPLVNPIVDRGLRL